MQCVCILLVNEDPYLRWQLLPRVTFEHSFGIADHSLLKFGSFQHFSISAVSRSCRIVIVLPKLPFSPIFTALALGEVSVALHASGHLDRALMRCLTSHPWQFPWPRQP